MSGSFKNKSILLLSTLSKKLHPALLLFQKTAACISHLLHKLPPYKKFEKKHGQKPLNITLGGLLIFFLIIVWNTFFHKGEKHLPPAIPVMVSPVQMEDVPLYIYALGTVTALEGVTVKTQVNGQLIKILFQEGQSVKKGQLLAQIDPQPYEALLKQYQGQLLKDKALLNNARLDLKRYEKLYQQDSLAQQTLDTQRYLVKQYEGIVKSDEGLVEGTKVNLKYCQISSPIDGIIGLRQVNAGNFVQTTDPTPLTMINAFTPISVIFTIPEDNLLDIQESHTQGMELSVDAFDRQSKTLLENGKLVALDNQIDTTTGTVKLRASFENKKGRLFPNQFVNVRIRIKTLPKAFVLPTATIQQGKAGYFVYSIQKDNKLVQAKTITVETTIEEKSAVKGDLKEGDLIVLQGQDKLTEGTLVSVVQDPTSPEKTEKTLTELTTEKKSHLNHPTKMIEAQGKNPSQQGPQA